jgi:peptidylprolyl isomerase
MKRSLVLLFFAIPAILWSFGTPEETAPGLYADISTSRGNLLFLLDYEGAPLTVTNFCGLAEGTLPNSFSSPGEPYFDGLTFYREAPDYALFSGDPTDSGEGGPGYTIPRETGGAFSAAGPGALLMDGFSSEASGSRFFITMIPDSFLDTKFTVFGQMVDGTKTLKKLKKGDIVKSVKIIRIGDQAENIQFDREAFDRYFLAAREAEITNLRLSDPLLADAIEKLGSSMVKTPTGIYYTVIKSGEGGTPGSGDQVSMHYTGTLLDGTVFDGSRVRGQTFDFVLGKDGVIPGWIEMVTGMNTGEIRMVVIPPMLAYGSQGIGPIKPNSWLVFEMELVSFVEG